MRIPMVGSGVTTTQQFLGYWHYYGIYISGTAAGENQLFDALHTGTIFLPWTLDR